MCVDVAPSDSGNERRITKSKGGFRTKTEALAALQNLREELERATKGTPKEKQNLTLAYYWDSYEKETLSKLSKQKVINYRTAYNRLRPLHNRLISNITVSDLRNIVSCECKTYYPARDMKTLLTKLYELAAADGVANKDLPSFIQLPKADEKEKESFTQEEAALIYNRWRDGDLFAGYVLLMMTTSMMPGELYKLRKDMINLEDGTIVGAGIKTKRRKTQSIVFPEFMRPIIAKLMDSVDGETILPRMSDFTFRKRFSEFMERAGCRQLTPYCCRHTTGTTLYLDASLSPAQVARVMRHSVRVSENYTHPSDTDAKGVVQHMSRLFTDGGEP
jgi:integrase